MTAGPGLTRRHALGLMAAGALMPRPARAADLKVIVVAAWDGWDAACDGFAGWLNQRRRPHRLRFADAQGDLVRLAELAVRAREPDVDLVVAVGSRVAEALLGSHQGRTRDGTAPDRPSLFMMVPYPVDMGLMPGLAYGADGITGTLPLVSLEQQMAVARAYRPFDTLAVVHNPLDPVMAIALRRLRELAGRQAFNLVAEPVPVAPDGTPQPEALPDLVDGLARLYPQWLYLGPDPLLDDHRDVVTAAAADRGLPVLSALDGPVRSARGLMAVYHRPETVGRLTAARAEAILWRGVRPESLPVTGPARPSILINMAQARRLDLAPPLNLLTRAELIDPGQ